MQHDIIVTADAPAAIGPYSQAVVVPAGRTLYASGQIPLDPATGQIVEGDAAAQCERVMENLGAVLAAAGMDFSDVVRSTIYLTDLRDFGPVNEVYGRRFSGAPPARATVQVAALPRGARVEIDVVAVADGQPGSQPA
jgi:2-iminobutanoate/2-iminopropanoate deaminase